MAQFDPSHKHGRGDQAVAGDSQVVGKQFNLFHFVPLRGVVSVICVGVSNIEKAEYGFD